MTPETDHKEVDLVLHDVPMSPDDPGPPADVAPKSARARATPTKAGTPKQRYGIFTYPVPMAPTGKVLNLHLYKELPDPAQAKAQGAKAGRVLTRPLAPRGGPKSKAWSLRIPVPPPSR